ncbi:uncharacterized protein IWZ02DRAFT_435945 [Phyllosticta citriasiana]|uniref:uncharacterized protein n=1 Tax=Phyllosticta citriasiana TaxID=595635 RepID=UPI0030FDCDF7
MPGIVKSTSKRGGDGRGATAATSKMASGIHPDDRELFAFAGIDYGDVPDLPIEQQGNGNEKRPIAFKDDEPNHFQASIADPPGIKLTLPFLRAQAQKGIPAQAAAADKAVTGLPLFVYGSSLFPEVLAQQLGLPKSAAMRLASNYIPAALPYCTRYCVAGDVPLAAVVRNHHDEQNTAQQYVNRPYREPHVCGALVMGIDEQHKQALDVAYGANFTHNSFNNEIDNKSNNNDDDDDDDDAKWGIYKRVAVGVRVQLAGWDSPGWVMADTYVWNKSTARLRCFQVDVRWTPQLFVAHCQKMRREAAARGVAYDGPPLWTPEDEAAWSRHQIRLRQAFHNRVAFENKRRLVLAAGQDGERSGGLASRKVSKEDMQGRDIISIDSDSDGETEREDIGNQTTMDDIKRDGTAPTTQKNHDNVEMMGGKPDAQRKATGAHHRQVVQEERQVDKEHVRSSVMGSSNES